MPTFFASIDCIVVYSFMNNYRKCQFDSVSYWYICFVSHQVLTLTCGADCGSTFTIHIRWLVTSCRYLILGCCLVRFGVPTTLDCTDCSVVFPFNIHYWFWSSLLTSEAKSVVDYLLFLFLHTRCVLVNFWYLSSCCCLVCSDTPTALNSIDVIAVDESVIPVWDLVSTFHLLPCMLSHSNHPGLYWC
jgi:hypothetical protein